jgi:APA family basic amino acid/polyamine antiporter
VTDLQRHLGIPGAAAIGVASMLGAGIFFVWAPAAEAAGSGLLIALGIAAVLAGLNALSTTRLAVIHPVAGGGYVYAGAYLGPTPAFVAGMLFLFGKTASVAAIAGVAASYLWPAAAGPLAAALVLGLAAINAAGIRATAVTSAVVAAVVVVFLVTVLTTAAADLPPTPDLRAQGGVLGVLQAAGLTFFAFAGYARVATLAEEVRDPARTLPRAVLLAVSLVLLLSAATAIVLLLSLGPERLAASSSPVAEIAAAGWDPAVRIVAGVACLGALLGVLAALSRTGLAMARGGDLPGLLAWIWPRTSAPVAAEVAVAVIGAAAALLLDPVLLIGASACAVLGYYAMIHLSSLRAPVGSPIWRVIAVAGLAGCAVLSLTAPLPSLLATLGVLGAALAARAIIRSRRARGA